MSKVLVINYEEIRPQQYDYEGPIVMDTDEFDRVFDIPENMSDREANVIGRYLTKEHSIDKNTVEIPLGYELREKIDGEKTREIPEDVQHEARNFDIWETIEQLKDEAAIKVSYGYVDEGWAEDFIEQVTDSLKDLKEEIDNKTDQSVNAETEDGIIDNSNADSSSELKSEPVEFFKDQIDDSDENKIESVENDRDDDTDDDVAITYYVPEFFFNETNVYYDSYGFEVSSIEPEEQGHYATLEEAIEHSVPQVYAAEVEGELDYLITHPSVYPQYEYPAPITRDGIGYTLDWDADKSNDYKYSGIPQITKIKMNSLGEIVSIETVLGQKDVMKMIVDRNPGVHDELEFFLKAEELVEKGEWTIENIMKIEDIEDYLEDYFSYKLERAIEEAIDNEKNNNTDDSVDNNVILDEKNVGYDNIDSSYEEDDDDDDPVDGGV